ncbi:hypothetical protein pEaSNUABM42_00021 [Erwinia phage pEa_SNUABM_42]|nr:hypothetical protein pEaSNUABM43_00021 [Erwinia phage pEa_SNUABM_43]QVW55338.1 hypothetical protein pEaSNUABM42_00021 [Erwinia phage pEa_SNUABM_42]
MKSNLAYNFNVTPFYQPVDMIRALTNGYLPETFIPKGRYDEMLLDTVLPTVLNMPMFREFSSNLTYQGGTAFRKGDDVPVITTTYNISRAEANAMMRDPDVFFRFLTSMGEALEKRALPLEEIFAVLLDAICASDYAMFHNMGSLH